MMFSPGPSYPVPPMIGPYTRRFGFSDTTVTASNPASATWEGAAVAVYMPIFLPVPCILRRVWWANGATTTGGATIEVGVYSDNGYGPGTKLISGSAVQGTGNQVQFVDVTDTALSAGLHWLAIMSSSATNTTMFRTLVGAGSASTDAQQRFQQSSANPLPSSATPVESTNGHIYLCGFATTASP